MASSVPREGAPPKVTAEQLASKQKEISVSEFFERNKQMLGFDSPTRALLTAVKEAVDNALDACEEAGIPPDLSVLLEEVKKDSLFSVTVEDNGPGIVKRNMPNVFGRLLFGSRFHAIRQSRGQQGIGISAVVMYAQLTSGKPSKVRSKTGANEPAHELDILLDTRHNRPEVLREDIQLWKEVDHGTRIQSVMAGRYLRGRKGVYEYLRQTAIVNPHARIVLTEPDGTVTLFDRATTRLPTMTAESKPHPLGIELGTLMTMAKAAEEPRMASFLVEHFSRVSTRAATTLCEAALIEEDQRPSDLSLAQGQRMLGAFQSVKLMAPSTESLSPIGEALIRKGLRKDFADLKPDFIITHTRPKPAVYGGHPFQVEAGLIFGGTLDKEEPVQILRYANRVPLLFQPGACAITHAVENTNWRRYGLDQRGGKGIPHGPVIMMVHLASTKVPFTSESKEAISDIPEVIAEIELALRACGQRLGTHLRKQTRYKKLREKEEIIRKLLPLIAKKSASIVGKPTPPIDGVIAKIMNAVLMTTIINHEPRSRTHLMTVRMHNYTHAAKRFTLLVPLPEDTTLKAATPKPAALAEGLARWKVALPSMKSTDVVLQLDGLEGDVLEEPELFVEGIDEELVSGAVAYDPQGGDGDPDGPELPGPQEEEGGAEVDTDADEDAAEDEEPEEDDSEE